MVGIVKDFSNQLGNIFVDRKTYVQSFHDDTVDFFRVSIPSLASRLPRFEKRDQ